MRTILVEHLSNDDRCYCIFPQDAEELVSTLISEGHNVSIEDYDDSLSSGNIDLSEMPKDIVLASIRSECSAMEKEDHINYDDLYQDSPDDYEYEWQYQNNR